MRWERWLDKYIDFFWCCAVWRTVEMPYKNLDACYIYHLNMATKFIYYAYSISF